MKTLKPDREQGIKAIIALQAQAGITETREQAERGWDGMSPYDQRNTMAAHQVICGGFPEEPNGQS